VNENILTILDEFDILCFTETHLGVRSKCPKDFNLVARSKAIESKSPRGGVAIYKKISSDVNLELLYDGLQDCVICRIMDTDILIVAFYIPPSNSKYFDELYFNNLDLIFSKFYSHQLLILGDLNSRIGTPLYNHSLRYTVNPDGILNANGTRLIKWLTGKHMFVVNGLINGSCQFDSKFTFYRGRTCSQNDLVLSNCLNVVKSFTVMEKEIYSDHTPTSLSIKICPSTPLNFIKACAEGVFSDDHYDINKRKLPSLVFSKINWLDAIPDLERQSLVINNALEDPSLSNDQLEGLITSTIYETCKKNYKQSHNIPTHPNHANCNSANYKAIADIHFYSYSRHTENGDSWDERKGYLEGYIRYKELALRAEDKALKVTVKRCGSL
jgi:hypothetical protein